MGWQRDRNGRPVRYVKARCYPEFMQVIVEIPDEFLQQHEIYDYAIEDLDKDMATLDRLLTANSR